MTRTHLITGASGQDGILLTRHLLRRGERVIACVGPGTPATDLLAGAELVEHDIRDIDRFAGIIGGTTVDAVHNLAAVSSVASSWDDPAAASAVNHEAVAGMLDVLQTLPDPPAFVQASSTEVFGAGPGPGATIDETQALAPVSPYGDAKAAAHRVVQQARQAGLQATNLILFGHTSPLHAPTFVLPRITTQAAALSLSGEDTLWLDAPGVRRDWGSARDFVRAFPLAAEGAPGDYVIGTGTLHGLGEIADWALSRAGVNGQVARPPDAPVRPHDFDGLRADTSRATSVLGWTARVPLRAVIELMVDLELARLSGRRLTPEDVDRDEPDPRC